MRREYTVVVIRDHVNGSAKVQINGEDVETFYEMSNLTDAPFIAFAIHKYLAK